MTGRDKVTYFSLSTKYQRIFSLYLEYFGSANICHILGKIFFIFFKRHICFSTALVHTLIKKRKYELRVKKDR